MKAKKSLIILALILGFMSVAKFLQAGFTKDPMKGMIPLSTYSSKFKTPLKSINSYSQKYFNFGIGASSWGLPIYGNLEIPIAATNQSISIGASYQSKKETYNNFFYNYSWRHSIIGIQAAYNYYLDDLLDELVTEEFDLYAGLQAEYYVWRTKEIDNTSNISETYTGGGSGGLGVSGLVGFRYHFKKKENISLNLVLRAGTVFSSARLGLSFKI